MTLCYSPLELLQAVSVGMIMDQTEQWLPEKHLHTP